MKDAVWYLLITAIAIPVGGWMVTHLSARISRATVQESAMLAAAQRRRDAEIAQLRDAQNDLLEAGSAIQSFAWYVDTDTRLRTNISRDEWYENREFIERAVVAASRLRAITLTLPTDDLRQKYTALQELIMNIVRGSNDENPRDLWDEDLDNQPDTVTRAIDATAKEIRRLHDTYPMNLASRQPRPAGWYHDPYQPWTRRYWDGSTWTEHTAP